MSHKVTLAIVAVVGAMVLTATALAVPQQALAYRHHNHNNSVKVDQQINQLNQCTGTPPERVLPEMGAVQQLPSTVCENFGDNSASVHR